MAIAAMLVWIFTAAAGVSLLAARRPARGSRDSAPAPAKAPVEAGAPAPAEAAAHPPASVPAAAGVPPAAAAAYAEGAKIPITHTRVTTRPGEHPLLEFLHPALGIVGLGCWIAFVITRFRVFAWVALGVIVVTIAAGVIWYAVSARARKAGGRHPARPARRLLIHGSGAAVTFVVAIVTALIAYHA